MGSKGVTRTVLIVLIYYVLYLTATILESDFWGNLPLTDRSAAFCTLLFLSYRHADRTDFRRYIWLSFCLASLSWAAADLVWAADSWALNTDPASDPIGLFCYFATSAFLAAGLVVLALHTAKNGLRYGF